MPSPVEFQTQREIELQKLRLHVLALPWTVTSKSYCDCAYTSKILKFCKMMHDRGHSVTHYGAEGAEVACDHVTVLSAADQLRNFGPRDKAKCWSPSWDPNHPSWALFNSACTAAISLRPLKPGDFICHITGASRPVAHFFKESEAISVEYGIGYSGTFAEYRAFESNSIRSAVWHHHDWEPDGRAYDWVIPNYFDVADFPEGSSDPYLHHEQHLLFVGRIVRRKGLAVAMDIARLNGMKLIIAGQGAIQKSKDTLVGTDGTTYKSAGDWEYVGHVDVQRRGELMAGARAILVPSYYTEPFGGVNVEAQLCGTPAITYDWGGFTETVENGKTGYRCMNLADFVTAAKIVHNLDRKYIRARAIEKYSLEAVAPMFEQWFQAIRDHKTTGWETQHPERTNLDWMK